jgi:hypothetical protein
LPGPLASRVWKLSIQSERKMHAAKPIFEILLVLRFHPEQMSAQRFGQVQRKHRDAIFAAFGVAHRDLAERKINVFYPQSDAFHQTQATPLKKPSH